MLYTTSISSPLNCSLTGNYLFDHYYIISHYISCITLSMIINFGGNIVKRIIFYKYVKIFIHHFEYLIKMTSSYSLIYIQSHDQHPIEYEKILYCKLVYTLYFMILLIFLSLRCHFVNIWG